MSNLMLLVILPFIASCIALATGATQLTAKYKKYFSLILSLLPLAILLFGYGSWSGVSFNYPWISALGIDFHLSVDALSLFFIALTAIITPVAIFAVQSEKDKSLALYFSLILLLQGFLFILFTARDLALFTIAWEAMLLPIYFIITLWGGPQRQAAALQFLIYMIAGSALFVAGVLALYFASPTSTFNLDLLANSASQAPYAALIFAVFVLAFAVKTPLFPFHAWLPEAYVEAPFAGTILLAALLSKAGIYGIARIGFGLFPDLMAYYSLPLLTFAIAGTLYGAITAWTQRSIKGLIAYSSLSHVNFILAGLFIASPVAFQGAILQAFNHGITIAALFLVTYWLQQRTGETTLGVTKGLAKFFPTLCWLTLFFVLSSVALPATNNFVGELLILFGLFKQNVWLAATLGLSVILSAIYMLRWMQKIYFEEPKEGSLPLNNDIGVKEMALALPLVAIILAVGIYPAPLLRELEPTATKLAALKKSANEESFSPIAETTFVSDEPTQPLDKVELLSLQALAPSPEILNLLAYNDPSFSESEDDRLLDEALQRQIEQQRTADNRLDVDRPLQRATDYRRDVENTLERDRELRRLEERRLEQNRLEQNRLDQNRLDQNRVERQRLDRRAEDRRAEERRLERNR